MKSFKELSEAKGFDAITKKFTDKLEKSINDFVDEVDSFDFLDTKTRVWADAEHNLLKAFREVRKAIKQITEK